MAVFRYTQVSKAHLLLLEMCRSRVLYGLDCHYHLYIIFTVTGFWDHPWMLRISLITRRISFATTSQLLVICAQRMDWR